MDIVKQFCWELDADEILSGVLCDSGLGIVKGGKRRFKTAFGKFGAAQDEMDANVQIIWHSKDRRLIDSWEFVRLPGNDKKVDNFVKQKV